MARSSLGSCQELSWILGDWDGELTGPLRKQVRRHISTCEICAHQFLAVPDPDGHVIVAIAYRHIELALSDERHQFRRGSSGTIIGLL